MRIDDIFPIAAEKRHYYVYGVAVPTPNTCCRREAALDVTDNVSPEMDAPPITLDTTLPTAFVPERGCPAELASTMVGPANADVGPLLFIVAESH